MTERICNVCLDRFPTYKLKTIAHKNYCLRCANLKQKLHRMETLKYMEDSKPIPSYSEVEIVKPKIAKPRKKLKLNLKLTQTEKNLLYFKHLKQGYSSKEASKIVNDLNQQLKELAIKLKEEYKIGKITKEKILERKAEFMEGLLNYER